MKKNHIFYKLVLLVISGVLLSACKDNVYEEKCIRIIEKHLRSPSSLQLKKVKTYADGQPSVFIDYDAANAYGTLVRGNAYCKYEATIMDGKTIPVHAAKFLEVTINGERLSEKDVRLFNLIIDMDIGKSN